jgi:hypothetical protein
MPPKIETMVRVGGMLQNRDCFFVAAQRCCG